MLKICFAGLGSIGKRHLRDLAKIIKSSERSIDALRSGHGNEIQKDILEQINTIYHEISELPKDYDIIFITNPTYLHYDTIKELVEHTKHMFIEKPVFQFPIQDVSELNLKSSSVYYVAAPLRYGPVVSKLKELVTKENVYSVRAICSSYLPDWRKGTDYRKNYSAIKEKGGGVELDLIHEMDYITYLFGMPQEVKHYAGKFSDLEIDSDDLGVYLLKYSEKLIEIHLDYFGRKARREIELYCKDYTIAGDLINNTIIYRYSDHIEELPLKEDNDFVDEIKAFLAMTEGSRINDNDIEHANEVLKLALKRG